MFEMITAGRTRGLQEAAPRSQLPGAQGSAAVCAGQLRPVSPDASTPRSPVDSAAAAGRRTATTHHCHVWACVESMIRRLEHHHAGAEGAAGTAGPGAEPEWVPSDVDHCGGVALCERASDPGEASSQLAAQTLRGSGDFMHPTPLCIHCL